MTTLAHIHEASLAIENTLAMLSQPGTDEKQARAALLDIYLAGYQKAKADADRQIEHVCHNSATAIQLSKVALAAIVKLEKEVARG